MNRLVLLVVVCLLAPGRASANMGRPIWGGSLTGEPSGIRDIAIQHEALVLDLRPIAVDGPAQIAATYRLENHGPAASLSLVFAAGEGGMSDFAITIDGSATGVGDLHRIDNPLPPSWRPPTSTPVPGGGEEEGYDTSELWRGDRAPAPSAFGFTLAIPPGAHTVAITYRAEALHRHHHDPTLLHQLAYVLAPARTWASFGGLDVTVHVPPGWDAAITPAMPRTGDTLSGTFSALPADAIALSIQAPATWFLPLRLLGLLVLALVLVAGGFVVARCSCRLSRPDAIYPSLTRAAGLGFLWALVFGTVGILAIWAPAWALPAGQDDAHYGYIGVAYSALVVLGALALWPIGAVVAWWADRRLVLAARAAELAALSSSGS